MALTQNALPAPQPGHLPQPFKDSPERIEARHGLLCDPAPASSACGHELKHPAAPARPITDIALSWGFNNLSHFSRVFREHVGQSPSDFRQTRTLRATLSPLAH